MKLIAALAALFALALAPAADAAKRKVPASFVGVNWDSAIASAPDALQAAQFPRMGAAGVETVRTAFIWAAAQPDQDGPIDLSATDRFVAMAAARRIEVFPHVIVAPAWARLTPAAALSPPSDPKLVQPYTRALILRYGRSGSFWAEHPELPKVPIRYWQFWNEPHLPYQWTLPRGRKDWAATYTRNLESFYKAVKDADPRAKVVLAGLTNSSSTFLDELYRKGARPWFDVAALHPYTATPAGVAQLTRRFKNMMRHHHDARKPVWVTELGLPASRGKAKSKNTLQTTSRGMASFLSGSFTRLAQSPATRVYWYTWASEYRGDIFRYTGLFRYAGSGQPRAQPAYRAFVRVAHRLEGK